jgi:hypothetical protein
MGISWFVGCILILFVLTFAMVWKLSTVLKVVRQFEKWAEGTWRGKREQPKDSNV